MNGSSIPQRDKLMNPDLHILILRTHFSQCHTFSCRDGKSNACHGWIPGTGDGQQNRAQIVGNEMNPFKPHFMYQSMSSDAGDGPKMGFKQVANK